MPFHHVMKRTWKLLQDSSKTLFRALGLTLLTSFFIFLRHRAVGQGYAEQTKIAIRRSSTTALLRALIHLFPVGFALWEIVLNWNTYFVGYDIYNQAYYQLGAKIHEVAIQASLSAVIFSYVRYELILGGGVPFGALFSGLQISQAGYLWSMELWGTILSRKISLKRKLRLVSAITVSVIVATVAGPSSAVLLVPRLDYWPAGHTNIWINATSDSLWPSHTNVSDVPEQCLNATGLDVYTFACPSHGWEAIQDWIYMTVYSLDPRFEKVTGTVGSPSWTEVSGHNSLRRLIIGCEYCAQDSHTPIVATGTLQTSAVADALTQTGLLWTEVVSNISTRGHGSILRQQDAVHAINNGYYQPYTMAACSTDVIRGSDDDTPLAFPVSPDFPANFEQNPTPNAYPGITKDQLLAVPGSREENRLKWVELPQDSFNHSAIGAVILLAESSANSIQEIVTCNLGAGWGSSIMNTSSYAGGTSSVTSAVDLSAQDPSTSNQAFLGTILPQDEFRALDSVILYDLPLYPTRPIIVTEDWANYLNPFIPALNTTVIDALMTTSVATGNKTGDLTSPDQIAMAQWVLTGLLANGLASIGATSTLQGSLRTIDGSSEWDGKYWFSGKGDMFIVDPEESQDWVKLRVDSTMNGYAYNLHGAAPKVATCFLLLYCIIALIHVLYTGITGISSNCWDSIGEVTALAMNSTPTTLLKNTCAGIMELNIFKIPVRVLAFRDDEVGDGEHLELVFGDVDEKVVRGTPIKPNRVYGTLPKKAKLDKNE